MKLLQNSLKQAEYTRTVYTAKPEPGTTLDEMLKPEYWSHVAKNLMPGTKIEVTSSDSEWYAELLVRSASGTEANVALLHHVEFSTPSETTEEVEIKHRGRAGWSAVRKSDKTVLFEGGSTREQAEDSQKKG